MNEMTSKNLEASLADHAAGRHAESPRQVPWRAWLAIMRRVKDDIAANSVSLIAAGVAFYGLLSLAPLLLAMVSIYSIFATPSGIEEQMASLADILPHEAQVIIAGQLREIVQHSSSTLGWGSALSILAALWSASKGSKALMEGFNIAYDEHEGRPFLKFNLIALGFTLGAVVFMIVALALIAFIPPLLAQLRLDEALAFAVSWGRWLVLGLMINVGLAILNRYAPDRDRPRWAWVSVGSTVSTVLCLLISAGFSFYASNFGKYNETYGSLGGVVVLLLWLYLSTFMILVGAEINAESELQTAKDTTVGKKRPLGARGAVKADHVPRAG